MVNCCQFLFKSLHSVFIRDSFLELWLYYIIICKMTEAVLSFYLTVFKYLKASSTGLFLRDRPKNKFSSLKQFNIATKTTIKVWEVGHGDNEQRCQVGNSVS